MPHDLKLEVVIITSHQRLQLIIITQEKRDHIRLTLCQLLGLRTINIFEGKLYIQTGHKKDVAKQIAANPLVELCAFDGQATWLRLSGTLVEDERIEAKKAMLDAYPELRGMYDENDGNTAVYYFKDATARFDSFVKEQEIEKF